MVDAVVDRAGATMAVRDLPFTTGLPSRTMAGCAFTNTDAFTSVVDTNAVTKYNPIRAISPLLRFSQ